MQPKYKIYATLLDSYFNYLNSDVIYERYYGWSENPIMLHISYTLAASE